MKNILLSFLLAATSLRLAALPAPDFSVTDSDGNQHNLYADYVSQGKAVVIEIFFVDCPPCASHASHFQNLYQAKKALYPGQVEFFLLTNKSFDNNADVAQYKIAKSLTMPGVSADGGSLPAVAEYESGDYGPFFGTPTFIVIAPNSGEVFFDVRGSSASGTMTKIGALLDKLIVPAGPANVCASLSPTGAQVEDVRYTVQTADWDTAFWAGAYSLWNFPPLQTTVPYTISAYSNSDPAAGVSTFDLVLMSKHILGITPFTQGWQSTAADVNLSNSVTTFDILETRKLLLGIYDTFPVGISWRFSPLSGTELNGYCLGFQGIKLGDVDGSYLGGSGAEPAEDRGGAVLPVWAEDRRLQAGEQGRLLLRAGEDANWSGLQMVLEFDPAALEITGLESAALPGFDEQAFRLNPDGTLRISWIGGLTTARLSAGAPWLSVAYRALRPARLSEVVRLSAGPLRGEAYAEGAEEVRPFAWRWQAASGGQEGGVSIWPNPASGAFTVEIQSAKAAQTLAQLFDAQGRLIFSQSFPLVGGTNRLDIRLDNAAAGWHCLLVDGAPAGRVWLH